MGGGVLRGTCPGGVREADGGGRRREQRMGPTKVMTLRQLGINKTIELAGSFGLLH